MELLFGDIVVVDDDQIGVVVKCWGGKLPTIDVYVRNYNGIQTYPTPEVERYRVRHKYLNEEELEFQRSRG